MEVFIPGLQLNQLFYDEVVAPLLAQYFPGLVYSAARLGYGSEVLGYDTALSMDHEWGPRLHVFVSAADAGRYAEKIVVMLRQQLPTSFRGVPTHFGPADGENVRLLTPIEQGPVNHQIKVMTLADFFEDYLHLNPLQGLTVVDWLTVPQQYLLGVTKGAVYADGLEQLHAVRQRLAYYPHDVWLYLMAAQWSRIGQEEAFVGRAGDVGDDVGSRLIAARLVHDVMLLCFLLERQYAPYPKWFGTAFAKLACANTLMPVLQGVLMAVTWQEREAGLCEAYEMVATQHNALGITPPLEATRRSFHGRPYQVIEAGRFGTALRAAITDETVQQIGTDIGSIDQFSDNSDLREDNQLHRKLGTLYQK